MQGNTWYSAQCAVLEFKRKMELFPGFFSLETFPNLVGYSVQCAQLVGVYSVHCAVCSVQCAVYSVQCTVYSVQCTVYSVQCAVYSVQCTVYSVQCVVCSVQCALYTVKYDV